MLIWFLDRRDNNDQNLVPGTHSFILEGTEKSLTQSQEGIRGQKSIYS